MATNSPDAKWAHPKPAEIELDEIVEEEEEALSLCDLPINSQQNHQPTKEEEEAAAAAQPIKPEEDFDFKSLIGSVLTQPQMCAADDVFFKGQIIPLRHSVSSEGGLLAAFSRTPSRCISRSESMDRFHSITGLNSATNSRSSSVRSLRSSSSGSSTTTTNHKHRVLNQFHSHPSPSPQIRIPSSQYSNSGSRVPKSHIWSFLRVGLVHTPEIELQCLKNRSGSRSCNKSTGFGSRNSNSSSNSSSDEKKNKKNKQRFFGNNGGGFFGGGCKCSVDAVETMPLRVAIAKEEEEEEEKGKTKKEKKQTVSRHRTFEWLKELSNAGVPD